MQPTKVLFLIAMTIGLVGKEAGTAFAYSPANLTAPVAMSSSERNSTLQAQFPFPFPNSHDRNDDWNDRRNWDHRDWDHRDWDHRDWDRRDSIDYCLDRGDHDDRRQCFDRLFNVRNDRDWRDRSDEIEGCLDRDSRDERRNCFEHMRDQARNQHWGNRDDRWYRNDRVIPFPPRRFPF